jgi:arabinan endo-1,5-alpha-L-arabinosidase
VVRDRAGYVESKPAVAEATTYVPDLDPPVIRATSVTTTASTFTVMWAGTKGPRPIHLVKSLIGNLSFKSQGSRSGSGGKGGRMGLGKKGVAPGVEQVEGRLLLASAGIGPHPPASAMLAPGSTDAGQPSELSGAVQGVSDPSIIKQGDTYTIFSTGPGLPIRSSTDLVHWQEIGQVFATIPAWAQVKIPGATGFWAPDITFFHGQYHLYYALSTFGSQRSLIGLATNTTLDPADPAYHWVDQGEVIESSPGRTHWNAIDPNVVVAGNSTVWLAFGSQWSGIKLLALDPTTGKPAARPIGPRPGPGPRLISLASRPESRPIEAAYIIQRNGYNYLFVSFDICCMGASSTYKIMVGRSRAVAGPYVDRTGKPMTRGGGTLVLAGSGRYRGPGHNSVLSDGPRDWLVYHAYDAQNGGVATLQIRPLLWTAAGWPFVPAAG